MSLLNDLLTFLTPYGFYSCIVLFSILIACGFGLPLPEDIVLITGGILASRQIVDLTMITAILFMGILIGDTIIFMLGRHFGGYILSLRFAKPILTEKRNARVRDIIAKYGDKVVFFARFMPGFRTPVFFTSGVYGLPSWKFFTLDGIAALISVPLWIYVGYLFGSNLDLLEIKIKQFQSGIFAFLGFVALVLILRKIQKPT